VVRDHDVSRAVGTHNNTALGWTVADGGWWVKMRDGEGRWEGTSLLLRQAEVGNASSITGSAVSSRCRVSYNFSFCCSRHLFR